MRAEVTIGEKVIEFDTGDALPLRTEISFRKCAKSPVRTYELHLNSLDEARDVAIYRVVAEHT